MRVTEKIVQNQLKVVEGMLEEQGNPQSLAVTNLYGNVYALVEMRQKGGYLKIFGGTLREVSNHLTGWETCLYRMSESFKNWKAMQG